MAPAGEISRRLLDPVAMPADRGNQQLDILCTLVAGETLVFLTRPNHTASYDWAYMRRLEVK